MSIKGIDAQLMVTRAAEYAKESSVQQRKNELLQDYLSVQAKVAETQEKQKVAKTVQAEAAGIQLDKDAEGYGGHGYDSSSEEPSDETDRNQELLNQLLDTEEHAIDIKV